MSQEHEHGMDENGKKWLKNFFCENCQDWVMASHGAATCTRKDDAEDTRYERYLESREE